MAAKIKEFKPGVETEPNGTSAVLRQRILEYPDIQSETVKVPEWDNVEIELRSLSVADYREIAGKLPEASYFVVMVIACSHDPESGDKLFRTEDAEALMSKHMAAVNRLGMVAQRLCGMAPEAKERAEKNS
jgi:hypothetical protein